MTSLQSKAVLSFVVQNGVSVVAEQKDLTDKEITPM